MNTSSVEERVIHMIAQLSTVRPAQIRPADRLREDLGLDSVCSMELLSMLAEAFEVDISVEEAMAVTTVDGAVAMARRHVEQRPAK